MRVIMVMFDTLTSKFLPNYGNDWVQAPNFQRLAEHCTRFDRFYGGSMPCMPARRELHTGKYNFLRRGWGPLEPFDRSVMEVLKQNGIYTHLVTDHSHYWEDGGATYHNRYNSWEGFRGQENDCFVPSDILPEMPAPYCALSKTGKSLQQHYRNRTRQPTRETMPSVQTFQAGLDFLAEHKDRDNWFLQIEAFDPHEPFYVPEQYRKRYGLPDQETLFWPKYGQLPEGDYKEALENGAKEYAALLTLCDENLGRVLDFMDAHDMWKDTALMVNTDHGFLLGEHEWLGKNFPPLYEEIVHLPFFLHLPGVAEGGSCNQLCATVDLVPTLLEVFGCDPEPMGEMDGRSILPALTQSKPVREQALFGVHGSSTGYTDGDHVFIKANLPGNGPLYEYTMMPTNICGFFSAEQLARAETTPGCRMTNVLPCMKIPAFSFYHAEKFGDRLYDLRVDPAEQHNILTDQNRTEWEKRLARALQEADAPAEEYERLGIKQTQE